MKNHSSENWASFVQSLDLSMGQTLTIIDMMRWIFEDGWISRNNELAIDVNDFQMREDWERSGSKVASKYLLGDEKDE